MARIPDLDPDLVAHACRGDARALDTVVVAVQPGVYALALRMLADPEDAADACQEILIRIVTHLGSFRGDAAFSTWAYRVARNHLLTAATRARESPARSFGDLAERLDAGLALAEPDRALTPLDRAEAHEVALHCTQGMLLSLDRDHRLAYVLDIVFGLPSAQAADVLEIAPAAYRKRLSRAKARLHGFMRARCGLVGASAPCRCSRQLTAVRATRGAPVSEPASISALRDRAAALYDDLVQMSDAAAVMRAQPDAEAPARVVASVRRALRGVA